MRCAANDASTRSPSGHGPSGSGQPLRSRVLRGTLISVGGQLSAAMLRLVSNVVLSRLLFPEAFGLMAIATLVITGLSLISNIGIQPAVVRHERGDEPEFLNTAWSLQVIRGVVLWASGAALAVPIARFYDEPDLAFIVPVASLSALAHGFMSTRIMTLSRHIAVARIVVIELSGQLAALVAMVAFAWRYPSIWALVVGFLVNAAVRLLLSHLAIPGPRDRFRWDRQAVREIFSFGKWILVSTLFTFLALQIDVALLGKLVSMEMLGVYSIGIMVAAMPREAAAYTIQAVLLPALAAGYRKSEEELRRNFLSSRRLVLPLGLLIVLSAAVLAPAFFHYLYDVRYQDAGWIAQLAMITLWFSYLHETAGRALLARGESRPFALTNVAKAVATGCGCFAGFRVGGLPGLMLGASAGALFAHLTLVVTLWPRRLASPGLDLRYTGLGLVLGLAGAGAPYVVVESSGPVPLLTLCFGTLVLTPLALWTFFQVRREFVAPSLDPRPAQRD